MEKCRWCADSKFIKKTFTLKELITIEWAIILALFAAVMIFVQFFGESHGMTALILVLGLVVLIPLAQVAFWIFGPFGLFTNKIPCPHCNLNHSEGT